MELKLENTESERTHELANLIRAYNRANRETSKSEPLNIYLEDEKEKFGCRNGSGDFWELA